MKKQYQCTTSLRNSKPKSEFGVIVRHLTTGFLVVGLSTVVQGCGSSKGLKQLSGRVTLADGSPLVGARLIFRSDEPGNFSATTDKNGKYSAGSTSGTKGIAPGTYVVTVLEYRDPDHPKPTRVNAKYTQVKASGLKITVPAEGNMFDIKLDPPAENKGQN